MDLIKLQSQLISHGEGWIVREAGKITVMVVKVPTVVYQACADTAIHNDLEWKQRNILRILKNWAEERYPGYGITDFLDMNLKEVELLRSRINLPFTWGMYLVLQLGATITKVTTFQDIIQSPPPSQIDDEEIQSF